MSAIERPKPLPLSDFLGGSSTAPDLSPFSALSPFDFSPFPYPTPDPTPVPNKVLIPTLGPKPQLIPVNSKQYQRILKRRHARSREQPFVRRAKSYLHESRHRHAVMRSRGAGGKFAGKAEKEQGRKGRFSAFCKVVEELADREVDD